MGAREDGQDEGARNWRAVAATTAFVVFGAAVSQISSRALTKGYLGAGMDGGRRRFGSRTDGCRSRTRVHACLAGSVCVCVFLCVSASSKDDD